MSISKILFFLLLSVSISDIAIGQSDPKKLEAKKKAIQKQLKETNALLSTTKKNQKATLQELELIKANLGARKELISTIRQEINQIDEQIEETNDIISSMQSDLKNLKDEYAKIIVESYKNRSKYDRLMFILASDNFNQAYKRYKYLQQYIEYRQQQASLIQESQTNLNNKVEQLTQIKNKKLGLLQNKNSEKKSLDSERKKQEETINKLKSKEGELKDQLKKKQKELKKLDAAIKKAIDEANKKGALNKAEVKLMAEFEKNVGKLPWPVSGKITGKFGRQQHPDLPGIYIDNDGINITPISGKTVKAVFDGEVTMVVIIPNAGKGVLVRHGKYISVYFQMDEINVKKGQQVTTGTVLGTVGNNENGLPELRFEIRKGKIALNPNKWLRKM